MSNAQNPKPSYKAGDIVHAPFASPNVGEVYSKHRLAYVAEVANDKATLVYISASGKPTDAMRYSGEISRELDGLPKTSFWDAGQTTTVSTDHLQPRTTHLRPGTIEAIEESIAHEKREYRTAQDMVRELRSKAALMPDTPYAAEKNLSADRIAARTESTHRHVSIDHEGNVRNKTLEQGWKHHGRVDEPTMAQMRQDVAKYAPEKALAAESHALASKPTHVASPNDGKIVLLNEKGNSTIVGTKTKELLRESFHGELSKAGHAGLMPDTAEAHKMGVSVAKAQEGEHIAVSAAGTHHVLAKGMPHPAGATVLDAVALRTAAKVAESALVRGLAGPEVGAVQGVMAFGAFFDNASGRALSGGALGQAVAYVGEKSGAFHATMKMQEAVEPVLDKLGTAISNAADKTGVTAFLGEQMVKQTALAEKIQHATGLDTVMKTVEHLASKGKDALESTIRDNVHGPDNPKSLGGNVVPIKSADNAADKAAEKPHVHDAACDVREQLTAGMRDAGNPSFKLSLAESEHLAKELAHVTPGDILVVEKSGEVYLSVAAGGQQPDDVAKSAVVFDADALRENAGIVRASEFNQQAQPDLAVAEAPQREAPQREMAYAAT